MARSVSSVLEDAVCRWRDERLLLLPWAPELARFNSWQRHNTHNQRNGDGEEQGQGVGTGWQCMGATVSSCFCFCVRRWFCLRSSAFSADS